jgi:hypothetical protein
MDIYKEEYDEKWISLEKLNEMNLSAEEFEKILISYGDQFGDSFTENRIPFLHFAFREFYKMEVTNPTLNRVLNKLFDRKELLKIYSKLKFAFGSDTKYDDRNWEIVWDFILNSDKTDLTMGKFLIFNGMRPFDQYVLFGSDFYEAKIRDRLIYTKLKGDKILENYVKNHYGIYMNPNNEIFLEYLDDIPNDINLITFLKSEIARRGIDMEMVENPYLN